MPRKAKEEIDESKKEIVKKAPSSKKVTSKINSTKKVVSKSKSKAKTPSTTITTKTKATAKATTTKTKVKATTTATTKDKSTSKTKASATTNKTKSTSKVKATSTTAKKTTSKKTPSKKLEQTTKSEISPKVKSKVTKKESIKKTTTNSKKKTTKKKVEIVEYYDLPYRYNQTVVKVLAQTPNTLFVYWDISDDDRKKYVEQYGEYFFNNTKPVLIVHNKTKNYNFEIDINDFANSWYLRLIDSNCDYQVELGRRPVNEYVHISNNYLYVTNSNEIESPNDHILFDKLSHFVYFKNVQTNETIKKHTNLTLLSKIGKISSVQEFYKKLYPDEAIDFDRLDLNNPSSNNPTSSFK